MSETVKIDKINYGFGLSLALVAIVNGFITIGKELVPAVKDFAIMVSDIFTVGNISHHWVGHAVIIFVLFLAFGLIFSRAKVYDYLQEKYLLDYQRLLIVLMIGVVVGLGLVNGYFFAHTFLGLF
ncbi:MAG: hypothetical protein KAT16_04835 [Candidatus Heimdallarchaeota archaeon]|nr:hypothetical protein [Candidatus Heimdallarchaeota archaeon]